MEKIDFVNLTQPAINDTNLNRMQDNIERAINAQVSGDTLPLGAIIPFPGGTIPENYLLCDGSAVSRTTYSLLFSVIGTVYGEGDGSTTFNLPDMRLRTLVGVDTRDTDFNAVGKTFGEKTHTLTIDEMPSHSHEARINDNTATAIGDGYLISGNNYNYSDNTIVVQPTGGGEAFNVMPPSMATNYIIKAFQSAGVVAEVVNEHSTSTTNVYSANVVNGTTLYSNASGISDGSFTLTDDIANYKRIKFFNIDGECVAEYEIFSAPQTAFNIFYANQGATNLFLYTARLNRNGRLLTFYSNKRTYFNGTTWSTDTSEIISIQKIVGYKY